MSLAPLIIGIAALTTGLVAGLFFTFSALIMPGLSELNDGAYIKAFQSIDRILQPDAPPEINTQPVFATVFFGAMVSLCAALAAVFSRWASPDGVLVVAAAAVYTLGMLVPTVRVHLPLNNALQTHDVDQASESRPPDIGG